MALNVEILRLPFPSQGLFLKSPPRTLCNVSVELITLKTLMERTHMNDKPISWFKLDCEGCEYDLIPLMSDAEWAAIKSMSGELHFDDIAYWNKKFLPPRDKVEVTHKRVCKYMTQIRECQPGYNFESKYEKSSVDIAIA